VVVTLAAALAVLLTPGCSGTPKPSGNSIDVVDFRFRPDAISVAAGQQVTIRITNKGKVLHNLSIPAIEADIDYPPGRSANLIFVAPASGPLEFFCKYHRDRGMTGAFIVRK